MILSEVYHWTIDYIVWNLSIPQLYTFSNLLKRLHSDEKELDEKALIEFFGQDVFEQKGGGASA